MSQQHEMSVLCKEGDTKFFWDPQNPESVENARNVFQRYTQENRYRAARMVRGTQGEFIDEFDPEAAAIVFLPPIAGG